MTAGWFTGETRSTSSPIGGLRGSFHYHALDAAYLVAIGETEPSSLHEVHPEDYGGVLLRREEWTFAVE